MSMIKTGCYIKIPKGTTVNEYGKGDIVTKRDSIAQVTYVDQPYSWNGPTRVTLPKVVIWANGNKRTELSNVTEVPAPAPRKVPTETKAKEPTLRQRMVKGTKWKLTEPAQVMKAAFVPVTGQTYQTPTAVPDFILPAGTEITIAGKTTQYGPSHIYGVWVPLKASGHAKELLIEFKELNKSPEQVGEAEAIPMFAIWDTKEQKYYSGYKWSRSSNSNIEYTDKLTKAKKFKRLADARVHALIQSGYYDNLPESWGSVPEWMTGNKMFDIPDTWEIVKYDKLTKKEIERIELVDTFKRSWSLRDLTVKYSSTVRKVYSDLEKKKKLNEWSAIMMFKKKREDGYGYWAEELDASEIADINKLLGRFGDDVKIQKGTSGFAVAIKDAMTATMIRLAYEGDLECAIIDFESMSEVAKK